MPAAPKTIRSPGASAPIPRSARPFVTGTTGESVTVCYTAPATAATTSFVVRASTPCGYDEVTVQVSVQDGLLVSGIQSTEVHTGAGTLSVPLMAGLTECRIGGVSMLNASFSLPVRPQGGVALNTVVVTAVDNLSNSRVATLALTDHDQKLQMSFSPALESGRRWTVDLAGKFEGRSSPYPALDSGSGLLVVRVLTGDVNGDGTVGLVDIAAIRGANRQTAGSGNVRSDLNADGNINLIDMALARSYLNQSVPAE